MKSKLFFLCFMGIFLGIFSQGNGEDIIVRIDEGWVSGSKMTTYTGETFYAFRSIPYAEAPVGKLRFADPVPKKPWKGVLQGTNDTYICPQINKGTHTSPQSEDCLLLNVYVKRNPNALADQIKDSYPVIAQIHGGQMTGSKNAVPSLGPDYLMDRDIILVTMNYRLGVLGLLSTGTVDAPGNAAYKDQILVLKWIQRNIVYFGGDPNSVTFSGHSYGGMCVSLHLTSPLSSGLFHKAIALSGVQPPQARLPTDNLNIVIKLATSLKCPIDDIPDMIQCLRETPWEKIIHDNINNAIYFNNNILDNALELIGPTAVVEKDFGQERFLIEDPFDVFMKGTFNKVPLLNGVVSDEYANVGLMMLEDPIASKFIISALLGISPATFDEIFAHYSPFEQLDIRSFEAMSNFMSDMIIRFPTYLMTHLMAPHVPVYYYEFRFMGRFGIFKFPDDKPYGVVHADDLHYIFYRSRNTPLFKPTDPEAVAVERWTRMFENFVKTGKPTNQNDPYLGNVTWDRLDLYQENYLEIGTHMIQKNGLHIGRFHLLQKYFPLSLYGN